MTNPQLITTPFAENGTKNIIPEGGAPEPQLATMQAGFPEITQRPINEGGIPPERADFNGILNLYGQHLVHLSKGLPYEFDQDFANSIGGYPLNARIMLTNGDVVQNTQEGNTNNPNLNMGGWKSGAVSKDVTIPTYKTADDGVNPVTGVADGAYFNVRSEGDDTIAIEYQNVGGSAVATGKSYLSALGVQQQDKLASTIKDESGDSQQQVNDKNITRFKRVAIFDDFLTPAEIANKSTTNLAAKLLVALTETNGNLTFTDGVYYINSPVEYVGSANISWSSNAFLKFGSGGSLKISGQLQSLGKLSANTNKNQKALYLLDASNVAADDLLCIFNPANNSFASMSDRPYYKAGEMIRAANVNGNTITTYGKLIDDYLVADVDVYKIYGSKVTLKNPNIIAEQNTPHPFTVSLADGVLVERYHNIGGQYAGIRFDRCYNIDVIAPSGRNNSVNNNLNYALLFANCQDFSVNGGDPSAARHAVALGGSNELCCVPTRFGRISNMTLATSNVGIGAADAHGNCEYITYDNCTIYAANIGGGNQTVVNCTIFARDLEDGCCWYASEILGGQFNIIDCTLITHGDGGTFSYIDLRCNELLKWDLHVNVQNLTIRGGAGGAFSKLLYVSTEVDQTKTININIGGGTKSLLDNLYSFAMLRSISQPNRAIPCDYIIVDGVYAKNDGAYLILPTTPSLAAKTRQQRQSGNVDLTIPASGAFVRSDVINFKYRYSKTPCSNVTATPVSGVTVSATTYNTDYLTTPTGLNLPVGGVAYLDSQTIRSCVFMPNKVSAPLSLVASWEVGISDV